jgi:hypothetical protein
MTYEELVALAKVKVASIDATWWGFCKDADCLSTLDRPRTLQKFAADTGAGCVLYRRHSVWTAWKSAPGPILEIIKLKYAVGRVLQNHPQRFDIIRDNPNITMAEAREKMRALKPQPAAPAATPSADIGSARTNITRS